MMPKSENGTTDRLVFIYNGEAPTNKDVVEEVIATDGVTVIAANAFEDCKLLKSVVLPDGVTVIAANAFEGCKLLKSVVLPETIERIDRNAFRGCESLTEIHFPDKLKAIGNDAFLGCKNLQNANLPDSLEELGHFAFFKCVSLKKLEIRGSIARIKRDTFRDCVSLEEVILPSTMRSIDHRAFDNCFELKQLSIPKEIESINSNAFQECTNLPIESLQLWSSIQEKRRENIPQNPWLSSNIQRQRERMILKEGPGADPEFGGETQRGYGPQWWAISRNQLQDFQKHPKYLSLTMREFVKQVLEPITNGLGIGYALFVNQGEPLKAVIMISHAWDEPLNQFVESILDSGEDGPFWICATAIYQNNDKILSIGDQLGAEVERGPFAVVLKHVTLMLAIITTGCDIYLRLWCVYELFIASKNRVDVRLCPYIDASDLQYGLLKYDECIAKAGERVNSKEARCGNPESVPNEDELTLRKTVEQSDGRFRSVDVAVELFRFLYLVQYPTEKIEYRKTSARDTIKGAIEIIFSRLPFYEQKL